jgi:ribosome-binding protein aMBF1 (putative translation factor)
MDYLDLRQQDAVYVEAIKDGEIIRVPERVAILEDLFILRKITSSPQSMPAVPSMAQNSPIKSKDQPRIGSIISEWKHGKFGGKKNNVVQDLIPNFNWEISKNRKAKNMTRLKLAQMISASEEDVKRMELGELPADDFVLISRIEQVFGINLRKHPVSIAQVNLADLQKRNEDKKREKASTNIFRDSKPMEGNDIEVIDL